MSIGDRIRDLRWDRRLKQVELARRAGIAQNTLSRIEIGETTPSVPTVVKIADVLEVPTSELLKELAVAGKAEAPLPGPAKELDQRLGDLRAMANTIARDWETLTYDLRALADQPGLTDREVERAFHDSGRVGRTLYEVSEVYRERLSDAFAALSEDERKLRIEAAAAQIERLAKHAEAVSDAAVSVAWAANEPDQAKRIEEAAEAALSNVVPFPASRAG